MRAFLMPPVVDGTRAPGPVLAVLGASAGGNGFGSTAYLSRGYASWLRTLSRQYFSLPLANNFCGAAGYNTADVLTQVPNVLRVAPDTVLLTGDCLRSDIVDGVGYADTIANMSQIIASLLAWGMSVIATTCPPDAAFTSSELDQWRRLNRWLINLGAGRADLVAAAGLPKNRYPIVVDVNPYLADPATGGWLAGMALSDGYNPSIAGAFRMAAAILDAVGPILPTRSGSWVDAADLYDAADFPSGNLLPTGVFAGTGGTAASLGTIIGGGQVATGWAFTFNAGNTSTSSIVLSKETPRTDGPLTGERQRFALYNSAAGGSNEPYTLAPAQITTNFTAGDTIVAQVAYEIELAAKVQSIFLQFAEVGPVSPKIMQDGIPGGTLSGYPTTAHSGVLRTPPVTLQSGVTALAFGISLNLDTSAGDAALAALFSDALVFKVA